MVQFPPFPLSGLADYSEEPERPLFRGVLLCRRLLCSAFYAGGQIVVYVLVPAVKWLLVDDLAAGQRRIRSAVAFAPGFVVVEEDVDHRMPAKKRYGFGQVDDRVQNRGVDAQSFGVFQRRYARKSINPSKAITVSERLSMVVICLGGGAAFEPLGAELPPSGIVAEPDRRKRRGRLPRNGPRGRMPRRPAGRCRARRDNRPMPDAGAKRRRGCGARERWPDARPAKGPPAAGRSPTPGERETEPASFFTVLQPSDRFTAVAPLQPHHEGEQCAAFAQSEVVPEILHVVHFETRRAFFPQG